MKHGHWGCPKCKAIVVFRMMVVPARRLVKLETLEDGEEHPTLHVSALAEVEVLKEQRITKQFCCPSCGHVFTTAKWWRGK
jgi:hypothetical protein